MSASAEPNREKGEIFRIPDHERSTHSEQLTEETENPWNSADLTRAGVGDPLGSPTPNLDPECDPECDSGSENPDQIPDRHPGPASGRGPLVVVSTPEQLAEAQAFFKRMKTSETDGQRQRARQHGNVFSLMQYREHPDTGEIMWSREQLDQLVAALDADDVLDRWAAIWQDRDLREDGSPVPLHMHVAIKLKPGCQKTIRWISDHAWLPASRVQTPKEFRERRGEAVEVGRLAGERAFYDMVQYLTHEKYAAPGEYARPDRGRRG